MSLYSLSDQYSQSDLDRKIDDVRRQITKQETTLASLRAAGHEVDDATRQLAVMLQELTALLHLKGDARRR
jgi:hypothetical protein